MTIIQKKIKTVIRHFKLYWHYLLIVLAFCFFPSVSNAETEIYNYTYNWTNSPYNMADLNANSNDTICKWISSPLMNLTYLRGYKDNTLITDFDFYKTGTDNYDYWFLGYNSINRIVYDGFASGFHNGTMICYSFTSYQEMVNYLNNISYGNVEIVEPTENYNVNFSQPTPIIFKYRNDNNYFDNVIITLDYLSTPQFSTETLYQISSTSATSTGVIYSNLMNGNWRVKAKLWNSINNITSTSTIYVNFNVSSSTVPNNTWPQTGLTDYNLNEITNQFSTTSIRNTICTEEQWENGNWWEKLSCNAILAIWNTADKLVGLAKITIEKVKNGFTILFPFNIPINIYNAWQDSENQNLPTGLTYISKYIDSKGNLTINIPNDFENQSSTTRVVIFGESIFREPDGGELDLFFGFIRSLSTYLIWGAFIFAIWNFGKRVYDDLVNIKKEDTL